MCVWSDEESQVLCSKDQRKSGPKGDVFLNDCARSCEVQRPQWNDNALVLSDAQRRDSREQPEEPVDGRGLRNQVPKDHCDVVRVEAYAASIDATKAAMKGSMASTKRAVLSGHPCLTPERTMNRGRRAPE